jgi:MFS family permease
MVLSLICLFVVGLGVSMQFALSSIRLIGLSQGRPDLAIGRASLAAGIAIAGAPFLLGLLGDIYGISRAYVMVFVLIIVAFAIIKLVPSHVKEAV